MSSQKGNISRQRPQKHQNRSVFKNSLHDTSHRTKVINNTKIVNVCPHCRDVIQWKIKYKKYKPLTQPKTCIKCSKKCIRYAYHVMCTECARNENACSKCCKTNVEIVAATETDGQLLTTELTNLLKTLSERKRRTFLRYISKRNKDDTNSETNSTNIQNELMEKMNELMLDKEDDDEEFNLSDEDESDNNSN